MFGFPIPDEVIQEKGQPVRYWGCRAIDDRGRLDILHDRITYHGNEGEIPLPEWTNLPFVLWLQKEAIPSIQQVYPNKPEDEVISFTKGRYTYMARKAGEYVYIGAWEYHIDGCEYDLQERPSGKWTGTFDPEIGDRVLIDFNSLGTGIVVSYFCEHGYRGVRVKLDNQPLWHKNQGNPPYALVFGLELIPA